MIKDDKANKGNFVNHVLMVDRVALVIFFIAYVVLLWT